ncbi:MAG TPA: phosphate-binding protein, partial [Blastocatellia bacterium]|nr:phosphate-binding protein [Blastocatellia bacterium]
GYIPYAYYEPNASKIRAVGIEWNKNSVKGPVMPTLENVLAGTYNPLSRPLFIYLNRRSAERAEVKEFVEFFLENGARLATEVKYLPLPASAYEMVLARFNRRETGTGFGGIPEVGLRVEEILQRTPKS